MRALRLLLQRLLVLGLGGLTVWVIAFVVFHAADRRLPLALALAVTYALAAYVILPRAIRLGLRILARGHVPSYTTTGDGLPGDPVNIALIGARDQLRRAFAAAGWHEADPLSLSSSWRMTLAFVLNRSYPTAPFSTLYLFGRGQDIGFQRPIGGSPRKRNHVRFWAISIVQAEAELNTPEFWRNAPPPQDREPVIWVGAGTRDTGLSLTRLSFQVTHATDADTNAERDFIIGELDRCGAIANVRAHLPGERLPIGKVNRYVTDGRVTVADLDAPAASAPSRAGPPGS